MMKILMAEDDDFNFLLFSIFLKDENCTVVRAVSGKDAVEKMKHDKYDVVFMDIRMPGMDGLEAAGQIRKFDSKTPIYALSACSLNEEEQSVVDAFCNGYLVKPVNRTTFLNTVHSCMKK